MHGVRVVEPGANAPPRRGEATAAEGGIRWGWVGGTKSNHAQRDPGRHAEQRGRRLFPPFMPKFGAVGGIPYLGGVILRGLSAAALAVAVLLSASAIQAQGTKHAEAEARKSFIEGRAAFEEGRFVDALTAFRRSYNLSGRGELQYNIGLAASSLLRYEDALIAYERYLKEVDNPSRKAEVQARVVELRKAIAAQRLRSEQMPSTTTESARADDRSNSAKAVRPGRRSTGAIVGPVILGAVGVGGVAAMIAGIAKGGGCVVEVDPVLGCPEKRKTSSMAYVYGGLGTAAITGAVVWLVVSKPKSKASARIGIEPTGLRLSGVF